MSERRSRPSPRDDRSSSSRSGRSGGPQRSGGPKRGGASGGRSGGPRPGGSRSRPFRDDDRPREDEGRTRRPRPSSAQGARDRGEDDGPSRYKDNDERRPSRSRDDSDRRPSRGPRQRDDDNRRPRQRDDDNRRPRRDDDRRPSRGPRQRDDDNRRPRRDDDRRPTRGPRQRDDDNRRPRQRDDDNRRPRQRDDDNRRPRRDDDRRPSRGPRRDDDNRRPRRDDDRRPSRSRADSDRRPSRPRSGDDRPRRFRDDDDRPQTAAQRRSREVRERTGGRRTELGMSTPPQRSREEWIDEGSVDKRSSRSRSAGKSRPGVSQHVIRKTGGARARTSTRPARGGRREVRAMDAVVEEIERAVGGKASGRVLRRYEAALASFEAHRYSEARIILVPLARECSDVAAIRELLGLCYYRESNWKKAIEHLEAALQLNPGWIFNHAVLADCHRALGNYKRVQELWDEIGEASPHPELLAEARIVYAMSVVDQGDLTKALSIMVKTLTMPKRVQEYHLRQWYVLADIHDRLGNIIKAREVFQRIADIDANFADVAERMTDLGA